MKCRSMGATELYMSLHLLDNFRRCKEGSICMKVDTGATDNVIPTGVVRMY